jgi:hypothetical protein
MKRLRSGMNRNALFANCEGAEARSLALTFDRVACIAKLLRDKARCVLLSQPKLRRSGIDFGGIIKQRFLQPRVDNTAVFHIVEAEEAHEQHAAKCNRHPHGKKESARSEQLPCSESHSRPPNLSLMPGRKIARRVKPMPRTVSSFMPITRT